MPIQHNTEVKTAHQSFFYWYKLNTFSTFSWFKKLFKSDNCRFKTIITFREYVQFSGFNCKIAGRHLSLVNDLVVMHIQNKHVLIESAAPIFDLLDKNRVTKEVELLLYLITHANIFPKFNWTVRLYWAHLNFETHINRIVHSTLCHLKNTDSKAPCWSRKLVCAVVFHKLALLEYLTTMF